MHALVELHIEQGIVLETHGEQIGVVTAIAAPHDFRLTFRGAATHAGATPMGLRRDALAGAAEAMVALERAARESPSGTTVGTVGVVRARPGAINVVPGEVELDVDVRDSDLAAREHVVEAIVAAAREIAARRDLEVEVTPIVEDVPVTCDAGVVAAAQEACRELELSVRLMTSGAYHDAMIMGRRVPVGMIFVPSAGGVSHHPDEYTAPEDLERGVRVLAGTLSRLAAGRCRGWSVSSALRLGCCAALTAASREGKGSGGGRRAGAPRASAVLGAEFVRAASVFRNTFRGRPEGWPLLCIPQMRKERPPPWASPKTVVKHARLRSQHTRV